MSRHLHLAWNHIHTEFRLLKSHQIQYEVTKPRYIWNKTKRSYKIKPEEETILEIIDHTGLNEQFQTKKEERYHQSNVEIRISLLSGEIDAHVITE